MPPSLRNKLFFTRLISAEFYLIELHFSLPTLHAGRTAEVFVSYEDAVLASGPLAEIDGCHGRVD